MSVVSFVRFVLVFCMLTMLAAATFSVVPSIVAFGYIVVVAATVVFTYL